jgi:hypothetical protein
LNNFRGIVVQRTGEQRQITVAASPAEVLLSMKPPSALQGAIMSP